MFHRLHHDSQDIVVTIEGAWFHRLLIPMILWLLIEGAWFHRLLDSHDRCGYS